MGQCSEWIWRKKKLNTLFNFVDTHLIFAEKEQHNDTLHYWVDKAVLHHFKPSLRKPSCHFSPLSGSPQAISHIPLGDVDNIFREV